MIRAILLHSINDLIGEIIFVKVFKTAEIDKMRQRHTRNNQGGYFSWSGAKFLSTYKLSKSAAEFWGGELDYNM